jgi:hypothetical protein
MKVSAYRSAVLFLLVCCIPLESLVLRRLASVGNKREEVEGLRGTWSLPGPQLC